MKKKLPPEIQAFYQKSEVLEWFKEQGKLGGKLGGKARLTKLSPSERSAIARKAALARWNKAKGKEE